MECELVSRVEIVKKGVEGLRDVGESLERGILE